MNKKLIIGVVIVAVIALGYSFTRTRFGAGLVSPDRASVVIGTSDSPQTLAQTYTTSSVLKMNGTNNIAIGFNYTPKSYGSVLYLRIDRSLDNGNTYVPYVTINPSTDQVYVYPYGTTGTQGIPFIVPGSGTSASGTSILGSFDLTMAADYVRVLAKESTTSTYGTAYINMLLNN